MTDLHLGTRFDDLEYRIDRWLEDFASDNPSVVGFERGRSDGTSLGEPRWYVRIEAEAKDFVTIWLTLGQRTLRYETYVLPAPRNQPSALFEYLLRRNDRLVGAHFSIGAEDAIYLRGELPDAACSAEELDRVIGTLYTTVDTHFGDLVRLGFGTPAAETDPPDAS